MHTISYFLVIYLTRSASSYYSRHSSGKLLYYDIKTNINTSDIMFFSDSNAYPAERKSKADFWSCTYA